MSNGMSALIFLAGLPWYLNATDPPANDAESGADGAGSPGYQTWPGGPAMGSEQTPCKQVMAAAAHHRAAAMALLGGEPDQAKHHAHTAKTSDGAPVLKSRFALASKPRK